MSRVCIFCGNTKLTKEHLLPKWMRNYFNNGNGLHVVTLPDGSIYKYTKETFSRTARIVCETCNSGWMSSLEKQVSSLLGSIISDKSPMIMTGISSDERVLISRWITKTITMLGYSSNSKDSNIPRSVPETLYKTGGPSPQHTIYMGYRKDTYGDKGNHPSGFMAQSPKDVRVKKYSETRIIEELKYNARTFTAALIVGRVYFYIVGTDIRDAFAFIYPYENDHLIQLWPNDDKSNTVWPPRKPIDDMNGWNGMNEFLNKKVAIDFFVTK